MSSPDPAPPRWRHQVIRSWNLAWRLGFAVLVGGVAAALRYGPAVDRVGSDPSGSVRLAVLIALDLLAAPVALVLLAWRRHPGVAALIVLLSAFSTLSIGAGALAAVSFAATQSARQVVAVGAVFTVLASSASLLVPDPAFPLWAEALAVAVVYTVFVLVGLYVRNRRQLVASLRAQAQSTRREHEALRASARSTERARIAREMHDALGHRLSVIAMHAGALESRDDLSPGDTQVAAGVVRQSAHQAMNELRQVLGVLNEASSTRSEGSDLPTLAQLDELVATGVGDGVVPCLRWETDITAVPDVVSRQLYRIAQEALTNVRKHAPGQPTSVLVRRPTAGAVELVVRNQLAEPVGAASSRHVSHGLAGLAERARLAGGSLTAGPVGSEFLVRVELPCRS